ncbi:hypothetical protein ACHAPG_010096 [Botrytis cinerea]
MKYAEGKWVHIKDRGSPDKEIISQRNIACHYGVIDVDFPHWNLSDWGKHTLVRRISKATMVSRLRNMDHFLTLWRISLGCIVYGQLCSGASITLRILTMFDQNFAECMKIYTALAQYWLEKGRDSYLSRVRRFDNLEIEPGWTQSSWCLEFTESAVEETINKKNRCSRTYVYSDHCSHADRLLKGNF